MKRKTVIVSINASWNIVNFRMGLIRALGEAGYRVVAVAPRDAHTAVLERLGVEYREIAMDKKGVSPLRDLLLLWRYWRLFREIGPDVFLGWTVKPNIYGSLAARWVGAKAINNVSGLGTAFLHGGLLTRIVTALYRFALRRSSTVFFQNEEDLDLFVAKRIVRAARARLLPGSGVDLERFKPAEGDGSRTAGFTLLLVARLLWDKGIKEYVEAARLVRRESAGARFQILGFLDVENRTAVGRAEVEAWVKEGVVDYLGEADDVRPYLVAADCVVLPSYREGLPRTLLEAAAMAKPLIATDVPGCRHVVADGVNGLLCRPRDARSLADAMLRMLRADPEQRRAWGQAGRARIEAEFDERRVAERYLTAIGEALG
ncbi:MAG TPA: glycosyltransferase family 4 protein [Allosphingosinicella sp.]|jgi:glycosyltransferase involved in cell wall biosynthesis